MGNNKKMPAAVKSLLAGSVLLGMSVVSQSVWADTDATVTGFAYSSPLTVNIASSSPSVSLYVYAGGFAGTYADTSAFIAYCADISQFLAGWGSATTYADGSLTSVFGGAKAGDLGVLANKYYSLVSDATTSAAFQIATWEILFETGSTYAVGSGSFSATGGSAATSATALAQTWLDGLSSSGVAVTGNYTINYLTNASTQDLVTFVAVPVPEPETYAMLLSGLAIMGLAARRKRNTKAKLG